MPKRDADGVPLCLGEYGAKSSFPCATCPDRDDCARLTVCKMRVREQMSRFVLFAALGVVLLVALAVQV